MSQLAHRLELPNELLFKILAQLLAHSVHMVVVSSGDITWHMNAHHTLSAVCFSFREIMKGISSKAFQWVATEATPNLTHHIRRQLQCLRALAAAIRDPATPGNFSFDAHDSTAPQIVQGYSLYIAIVYLRTQAARSTPEIYQSTSGTIFGAVITLSKVLYSRIVPQEVAIILKNATKDEAELSHIGVLVVKHCALLSGFADALAAEPEPNNEVARLRRDINRIKTEQMINIIESADAEFLILFNRNDPLPCCSTIWISQLPDVYSTLERICEIFSKQPLISDECLTRLQSLVARWAPPPTPVPDSVDTGSQTVIAG
ncbi:hypothetical protein C8F04DRAFT_328886 [Mycena alexandri]|uniref:Uncharacterized protein n=1 Tax=Mycena alexandri TaxID=1745969 RepID=A0AAD6WNU8_9AGAR|nr:hypothetical protein C8F04DRAFT_328886 [Mycena alexandri]